MTCSKTLFASLLGLAAFAAAGAHAADAPAVQLLGKGAQVYGCQAKGAAFAWTLKGPDARLLGPDGQVVGRHFAGPSWQAQDGSVIVGEPLAASPSPQAGSVAWLVLRVKSATGAGLFANIAYVTRTATQGGVAPAGGCDAAHVGAEARVPYSATYTFFPVPPAATH